MTDFEKVLMNRDGMSREEAKAERQRARAELQEYLAEGETFSTYEDIEDMLLYDYGLEMDYIFDLL